MNSFLKYKLLSIITMLVVALNSYAQIDGGFTDDFSDGDFTANPQWTGETTKFQVNGGELQLNDSEASTAMLSTECHAIDDAEWTFKVRYGFNPSTNNFCDVYIVSDNANPFSCTAGYFVRVCGVSTTDNICLYRKNASTSTKIIDGRALTLGTNNTFKIKVTRTADGEWKLYTEVNDEETYYLEGETTDLTYSASRYFGLACKYTVSNATKIYFDDFSVSGTYFVDTDPPALVSARFSSNNSVLLTFDEDIRESSIDATNFSMDNGIGEATSATLDESDAKKIILQFENNFSNGTTYTLTYGGISDSEGNAVANSTTQMTFVEAGTGSVVINEIMADPTPVVGLPESEYLELYNNSPNLINIEGWTLKIGTSSKVLGAYTLYPSEYVVICRTGNDTLFDDSTNILPVNISATALTNGGTTITLYNEFMSEVDKVTYSPAWYMDASKKDGGWSLERIDPNNRCEQSTNWRASENENGGTPGRQNSIFGTNIDETAPSIIELTINSANELHITFSEAIDTTASLSPENYELDNGYGNPTYIGIDTENSNIVVLMFASSFEQNHTYNLTIENIADFCGNVMERQVLQYSMLPPSLLSARFLSNNSILLTFDEEIMESSINSTNFSMDNGIGQATSATLLDSDAKKISVIFGENFTNGNTYTLTYGGMADNKGCIVETSTTQMTFIESGTGSVVINEIMADPTPVVGLPESEYIELYNNSSNIINLEGWTLKIGVTSKVLGAYTLLPSEYVVICRTGNDTLFYDINNLLPVSISATALTNGGTTITLYNEFMSEVDKITYSSAWYKNASKKDGGWSLERIDPNNRCEQSTNWRASENENGGTPGRQNSILGTNIDETAPSIIDLSINSANELHLTFSETVDTSTSLLPENYTLDNDYGNPIYVGTDQSNPNLLILMFSASFEQNRIYNLTVENIADLCGNIMERQVLQFSTVPIEFNTIVVSEIMSKPAPVVGLPDAKYIEIYNRSANAVSLTNWKITLGSTTKTFPSAIIDAHSYLVLTSTENAFLFEGIENIVGIEGFPAFAQGGTSISLYDKNGNIVHTLTFSSSWHDDNFKAQGGYSLEMVDLDNPCEGAANWRSTLDSRGGTPGKENSVNASNPDRIIPYPTDAEVVNDTVVVYFSEVVLPEMISAQNFSVEELGNPTFIKIVEPQLSIVKMKFDAEIQQGKVYMLNVSENIIDCSGNNVEINTQIRFGIGQKAEYNDLAINELLFNPYSGGSDFVELYNRSDKVIDLKDLWVSNTNDDGSVKDSYQITNISRLMLPQEYCAISTDIDDLHNHYSILHPENLYKVTKMPSMSDDKGTIIITGRAFDTIDIVSYSKSQHYKLLSSQDGVSLERINYDVSASELSNWHSAAQDAGFATPGYVNSQYHDITEIESQITLSSEVFSPDNDGYEDQLVIMYSLDVAGYSGTIAVYSSNGRLVRTLLNNRSLGTTGDIVWDGFDADNRLCPPGIYVVYVELFNLDGQKIVEKHVVSINSRID